ncbi:hypothetical protein FDZ74_05135, partial [bacterium]
MNIEPDPVSPVAPQPAFQPDSIGQAFELAIQRIFALSQNGGSLRGYLFQLALLLTWIVTAFWYHPW